MKTTWYFEHKVRLKRPYLQDEWCQRVLSNPVRTEVQTNGRIRHWGFIPELGHFLRVVTLDDGETVLNAFADSGFKEEGP